MKTKNYFFASANTGDGFVSRLDKLNSISRPSFTYIIKGGPGTGKSTMMKKIAQHFYDKGLSIELFYCSTDPKSLDAVRIVEKNVLIVDGTAPHIVEPQIVGLTHKIIDNGSFIGAGILKDVEEIIKLSKQKKLCFDMLYKNLVSAKNLDDINIELKMQDLDFGLVQKKAKNLFSKIKKLLPNGENKTLFLDAINNEVVNLEKINKFKVIAFSGDRYESFLVLEQLSNLLEQHKLSFVKILDVLNPQRTNAILINNIYLIKNIDQKLKTNKKIEKNNKIIKKIINFSKNNIFEAKKFHKEIEKYYIKNVNFEGIEKQTEKVIEEIEVR